MNLMCSKSYFQQHIHSTLSPKQFLKNAFFTPSSHSKKIRWGWFCTRIQSIYLTLSVALQNHHKYQRWTVLQQQLTAVCCYHVMYPFYSESTLYSFLNVMELLAQKRRDVWSLSDNNRIRTNNHLVCKQRLNHFTKLAKWLSCVLSNNLCYTVCLLTVLDVGHFQH